MIRSRLIDLPRTYKRLISLFFDLLIIWSSLFSAFLIRLGWEGFFQYQDLFLRLCLLSPVITLPISIRFGLYRAVLRFVGPQVTLTILRTTLLSVTGIILSTYVLGWSVPRSIPFLFGLILLFMLGISRYGARYWLAGHKLKDILLTPFSIADKQSQIQRGKPVAIYGAGEAGCQLVSALDRGWEFRPVVFLDDDSAMVGRTVYGRKVYHSSKLPELVEKAFVDQVLLAMPSLAESKRKSILRDLESLNIPVMTMPGMDDLVSGRLKIQDIKEVEIGDLLGRAPVQADSQLLNQCIHGLNVMVTGAGGSIGSELCRQIAKLECKSLVVFDHSEYNLYRIEQEIRQLKEHSGLNFNLISVLGSVNDPRRLLDVIRAYKINTIYHAAAYKHVPIVEHNISQGVRNNIMGTLYTAQAAMVGKVANFVLISTDKAVRPTNVMGATKRFAEQVLQAFSNQEKVNLMHPELFGIKQHQFVENQTRFTMVRFGNVLGSSGSVIPLFREQIRSGGPVTVTHPEITRYFMTIPEAAQLVIQAGSMGAGGDVFLLDMGEPVKIADLARHMIRLSGFVEKNDDNPEGDIEIQYTGLRPGEKLYEELLIGDNVGETDHPLIYRAMEESSDWMVLTRGIEKILSSIEYHDYDQARSIMVDFVSGFTPDSVLVDWLFLSSEAKQNVKKTHQFETAEP
ncbi:polysaccharide biosynthesis protein [Endozoicomonas elysicola]|uniref:polysaccharide biosynthesis protein n=1 Tax=Endozoicomonas elysicola TaxID=305900 RepID=UPI000685E058|nr:nucleoside-diphosphate sugar epimerase/dehydratase [Endozoicomonas elysicola]